LQGVDVRVRVDQHERIELGEETLAESLRHGGIVLYDGLPRPSWFTVGLGRPTYGLSHSTSKDTRLPEPSKANKLQGGLVLSAGP
jgi:hypothetical protein